MLPVGEQRAVFRLRANNLIGDVTVKSIEFHRGAHLRTSMWSPSSSVGLAHQPARYQYEGVTPFDHYQGAGFHAVILPRRPDAWPATSGRDPHIMKLRSIGIQDFLQGAMPSLDEFRGQDARDGRNEGLASPSQR